MGLKQKILVILAVAWLGLGFVGCDRTVKFPNNQVVRRAIAMQIEPPHQRLGIELDRPAGEPKITKLHIRKIKILAVGGLPTYKIQGNYDVLLKLPQHELRSRQPFLLYIQQQAQGRTWRLLYPDKKWRSYLIQ